MYSEAIEDRIRRKVDSLNPHWADGQVVQDILNLPKRRYFDLFFPLVRQWEVARAVILMGPRRVGKTILLQQTISKLILAGHSPTSLIYLSLDEPLFYKYSLEQLLSLLREILKVESLDKSLIIFDEIQYLEHWDVELKILVDHYKQTKFIASGSAAGVLRKQSIESGAGRFTDFMLPALTFYEYLDFLNLNETLIEFDVTKNKPVACKNIDLLNQEFIKYLNYGGFPEAVFNQAIRENPQVFIKKDIIDKVLLRDLPKLYGIENVQELNRLFGYLCFRTGSEINYENLSQSSGIAKNTIKKYLDYLEAAFLIRIVKRVDESGKTFKRENYFKIYVTNPSMYCALYGIIDEQDTKTMGALVETAIFSQFAHDTQWLDNIYYARFSKGKGEVDMVYLDANFKIPWCLEIKWSDRYVNHLEELKSLMVFCQKNRPRTITVSTHSIQKHVAIDGLNIQFKEAALICYSVGFNSIKEKSHI